VSNSVNLFELIGAAIIL